MGEDAPVGATGWEDLEVTAVADRPGVFTGRIGEQHPQLTTPAKLHKRPDLA